ncbi:MAG: four helix bundle protein [Bradymonadales bacterium]|nr:four helix bundle protein [Bradymonadales bacterium]
MEFWALAAGLFDNFPRGHGTLVDQLKRASLSIPLHITEGYGKRSRSDRARSCEIAKGSAHECGAILDAALVLAVLDERTHASGKTLLHRIVSMLVRMVA